jgi:hypothetical protein
VFGVPQHKLKCVLARSQFNVCFGLAGAEMKMSLVLRDRLVCIERLAAASKNKLAVQGTRFIETM